MITFVCFPCYRPIHYPSKQITLYVWLNHFAQVTQKTCIPSVATRWTRFLVNKTCQLCRQAEIDVSAVFLMTWQRKQNFVTYQAGQCEPVFQRVHHATNYAIIFFLAQSYYDKLLTYLKFCNTLLFLWCEINCFRVLQTIHLEPVLQTRKLHNQGINSPCQDWNNNLHLGNSSVTGTDLTVFTEYLSLLNLTKFHFLSH